MPPPTKRPTRGFVTYVRPDSDQLFILFTGNANRMVYSPMEFVSKTGIGDRNLAIVRDPYTTCYQKGISETYSSLDGIALLDQLVDLTMNKPKETLFHFYYATTNPVDRFVGEAFRDCPGVVLHPITPSWTAETAPPHSTIRGARPDHFIVQILSDRSQLSGLFTEYL